MQKFVRFLLIAAALGFCNPSHAADRYEFDKEHSHILFFVNHLGFSNMLGMFSDYEGSFKFDKDHPQNSSVDVTLHPKGIKTTSEILDRVLQGESFFNTSKYPDIRFISNSTKVTGNNTGDLTGNLTMLGVTKPVTLHVTFNKAGYHPITNLYMAGFSATANIKRSDFGMTHLINMVGDDVRIQIEVEAVNANRKEAEKLKH